MTDFETHPIGTAKELERLTAQVKVLESDDHEWYLQAQEIERLTEYGKYMDRENEKAAGRIAKLEKINYCLTRDMIEQANKQHQPFRRMNDE